MVNKARASAFGSGSVSVSKFSTDIPIDTPKVSSITYVGDDTATNTAGGDTITINGSSFKSGCFVFVDTTRASVVSFISSTQITFTAPAKSAGTYTLYVFNPDGGTAIYIPGINYSGTPTWSTASGSIGTAYETVELSSNVSVLSASSNSTVKYRLYSGSLPTNAVLNTNTGAITGITNPVAGVTTYTFVIEAYDLENQGTLRTFSITINPDVVTWSSPADGALLSPKIGASFTQSLSASAAIPGRSVIYTANTLPTGLSISGNTITGTPTVLGNSASLITATASSSGKSSTRTFLFYVSTNPPTTVEYLVIAGGGGGGTPRYGNNGAGGGGAGGLLANTLSVLSGTAYTVTVGAGGVPVINQVTNGSVGSNSVFASITTIGGGSGYGWNGTSSLSGGSGGGGGTGTAGPPRQGYDGGGINSGGGGAGAVGGAANGGDGASSSITGVLTYYAGGGGSYQTGSLGGLGGGGNTASSYTIAGGSGSPNTGSGGAAGTLTGASIGGQQSSGGSGGTGVVIIAYPSSFDSLSSISAGLTYTLDNSVTRSGYKVYKFTAGTGTISW